jgi:tape measure domain-containing protein
MANIDIVIRDSGTPVVVRNLQAIANEARNAHQSINTLNATLKSLSSNSGITASLNKAMQSLSTQIAATNAQAQKLYSTLSGIGTRALPTVNSAVTQTTGSFGALNTVLALAGTYMSAGKLMEYADSWNSLRGLVATSTKTTEEAVAVSEKLFQVAQKTRAPLNEMADLYTATARAGLELGKSQNEVLKFTEGVGKALAVQHIGATQAKGALIQLGQAISMGRVRSQEYNSLLQNGQVILQTVSRGFFGAAGTVAMLTDKVKNGTMTSKEFFEAFLKGSPQLDATFEKTSFLFSQAFTVMKNAISAYLGKLDESIGASAFFVKFVQWLGANLPIVAGAVAGLGTAIAVAFSPLIILQFTKAITFLWGLLLANPFVALAALIAGAVVAITLMKDEILLAEGSLATLGDLLSVWIGDLKSLFSGIGGFIGEVFSDIAGIYQNVFGQADIYVNNHTKGMQSKFADTFSMMFSSFENFLSFFAVGVDVIGTSFAVVGIFISKVWDQMVTTISDVWDNTGTRIKNVIAEIANAFIEMSNMMTPGGGQIPLWDITPVVDKPKIKTLGALASESFQEGMLSLEGGGPAETYIRQSFAKAQALADARPKNANVDLDTPMGKGSAIVPKDKGAEKAAKELDRLKEALERVIAEISPMEAAYKRLGDAQDVLNRSVAAGLISQSQSVEIMDKLKEKYKDVLDPLGAMNEELDRQAYYLSLTNEQARIEEDLYRRTEGLKRAGVTMTKELVEQLRAKLTVEQELAKIANAREGFREGGDAQQMKDFQTQLAGFKEALNTGELGGGGTLSGLQQLLPWADFEGTQEKMDAYVSQHQVMYEQIDALQQKSVISQTTADNLRKQADLQYMEQRLSGMRSMFSAMAGLQNSSNKKLAMIGKAGAIATATIDGYVAVQKAYTTVPYPYNIPAAIAQGVLAAANVANIVSTPLPGYRTGGDFTVGGSGGDDSQTVAFRATPGERVTVNTPTQARALESNKPTNVNVPVTVVNTTDPQAYIDALDTSAGGKVVLNHVQSDPSAYKRALGIT